WIQTQKRLKTEEFETIACVFIQTPSPLGTPSYPRGRVVYLVFEDGGVPKHQQNKNLPDSNNLI
ncbi:MAG: hypothetical protein IKM47_03720, partial [Bacteroidaceae bacterium]|nr:hypothetical protein [Bacteroidaceae bacterium]